MIIKSWKYMGLTLLVTAFLYAGIVGQDTGDFERLTLQIATPKREVLPIEPIPITIRLSNKTGRSITGHTMIHPGIGFLKIYVAKGNQPFEEFRSSDWPAFAIVRPAHIVLKPGFHKSVSGYLFYAHPANPDKERRGQYLLESPGTYRIKAILKDLKGQDEIESNILSVKVKQPTGEDAAAYEFLKNLTTSQDEDVYYGNFLLLGFGRAITPRAQKVLDKKEEFISRFPNSRYARYVYYSLGRNYSLDVGKGVEHGIKLLEKAASYEDFLFAKEALLKLIKILSERGESIEAWKYKVMFAKRFPRSEEGRDYLEEVLLSPEARRTFVWPLVVIVGAGAGIAVLGIRFILKRKTSSRTMSHP